MSEIGNSRDDRVVALLAELVAVDSVNPGLVPGAAGETAVVALLADRLRHKGFEVTLVESPGHPGRPSLLAVPTVAIPDDVPTVVLNGHVDTVGVAGMAQPFTPRVEGDRMYGRGAGDMKGGLAAMVVAAERLVARRAGVRPVLALVADEEDASRGSEAIIEALHRRRVHPDVCLIAEPTDLALTRSLRGFVVVRVRLPGHAAHSSQAHLGVNAVSHLGQLIATVDERATEVRSRGGDLMVTLASGGSSAFVVPDHAECLVEARTTPEQDLEQAHEEVRALLDPRWQGDTEAVAARPGWRMDADGPAATFAAALADGLGTGVTFDAPYWMEAPLWQQVCPTVVCGPGGGGLHAVDEWVDLRQVRRFTDVLESTIPRWSAGQRHHLRTGADR